MRAELPTGTVTFLFTDIEGSTRLLHALGPDAYAEVLAEHRRVLRDAFAAGGGVEIDTQGDAFFVAFPTAQGAAEAALAGHEALAQGPVRVRIGLHTGTPSPAGEGYVGIDVHRGARVAALAHGGQTLLSPATASLLDELPLRELGLHRLKDFDGATRLFQLGDGAFPPLRTPGSIDLPEPATRFLGRERELFDAVSLVYERDPRVLTILGPGGTGKTRFAIELARLLSEDVEGGTVFVALAPLTDSGLVLSTLGERLGAGSGEVVEIAARIGARRTHVVCDNLEHLLPAVAVPLAELVAAAPALRLLATSREALRIQGEVELDLPTLAGDDAVSLFCERAQAVRPDVRPSDAVHELCKRLDRLPLALELAAARTKLLAPEALLERLGDRLDLLQGARDVDERHATLRATISWSFDLLGADEQRLFARLSVFRGGATLEAAEAVCDADLETLASLLDKSLLRRRTGSLGEERFWMLETIRDFAREELENTCEAGEIRRRHAEYMLELARSAHLLEDDDEPFQLAAALAERDNLRAALDWTAQRDPELGLELAVSLETFWGTHAPAEGVARITDLLDRQPDIPPLLRARALRSLAGAAHQIGELDIAQRHYENSLRAFEVLGDERGIASLRLRLASRAHERGEPDEARRLVDLADRAARGRYRVIEAQTSAYLGRFAREAGDLDEAEAHLRRSRDLAAELEWRWWEGISLSLLLDVARLRGDLAAAEDHGRAAVATLAALESRGWCVNALLGLADVLLARGELERAGVVWGALCSEGARLPAWETRKAIWAGALVHEEQPAFLAAVERGRSLDLWDAAAIAADAGQTVP